MKSLLNRTFIALSITVIVYSNAVLAQSGQVSVVVLHSGQNETTVRLAAELSALGYSAILVLHPNEPLYTDQVRAVIRNYRAAALINAVSMNTRVEIWFPTPGGVGSQLTVDTVIPPGGEGNAAPTILKTVETLRAGLLKLNVAPYPRLATRKSGSASGEGVHGELGDDDENIRTAYPRGEIARSGGPRFAAKPGRASLLLGPAIAYGFADYPPSWQVLIEGVIALGKYLSITVSGFAPTAPIRFENEWGKARLFNGSVILGFRLGLLPAPRRFVPYISVGFGPHFTRIKGEGRTGFTSEDDRLTALEALFLSGFRLWITQRVGMEIGLFIGDCFPKPVVKVGLEVTSFSRPIFGGSAMLSVELF